jgi:hypothetical protein
MKRITLGVILTLLAGLLWYRYEYGEWYVSLDVTETEQDR